MSKALRVADAHSDLLVEVEYRSHLENPFKALWLEELNRGGVHLQVCALWTAPRYQPEMALRMTLSQLIEAKRAVAQNPSLRLVLTAEDLDELKPDQTGLVLSLEGCEPLGVDPRMAHVFWDLGVRAFGLSWATRNHFADGNAEGQAGGMSAAGRKLVGLLADLGAIVDLAHATPATFQQALELIDAGTGVMVSHTGCRALHDTQRNVDDGQIRQIGERGGVVGIMAHPLSLGPDASTIDGVLAHVAHARAIGGPEAVCFGGDFALQVTRSGSLGFGWEEQTIGGVPFDASVPGFEGPGHYPAIAERLTARVGEDAAERVLYSNLTRFLHESLPAR